MAVPIVQLNRIAKSFESSSGINVVLAGVDVRIDPGQKVSLIGPSGSGKSTLLSIIAGLLRPDTGTVEIDGVSLTDLNDAERALLRSRQIGIALQSENLIPFLTAVENIELALGFGGRHAGAARAYELLERMGVAHRATHFPRQISGGEAQRVSLAVALANSPRLLLADEMVAQLDTDTAGAVVNDILETDVAVLFVTHDMTLADRADLQLRLQDRTVVTR